MCGNCLDNATILEATTRGENRKKKKKVCHVTNKKGQVDPEALEE